MLALQYFGLRSLPFRFLNTKWICIASASLTLLSLLSFSSVKVVRYSYSAYQTYLQQIIEFNELFSEVANNKYTDEAIKKERGELYVLIIGESHARDSMQIYSGPIQNTPWLMEKKNTSSNWIFFENAYSNHTHTLNVLTSALTSDRVLTGIEFPKSQNFISLFNQAGFNTIWISNQMEIGPYDTPIAAIAHLSHKKIFANGMKATGGFFQSLPDEVLIPHIFNELEQLDLEENNLLVIHLMGSHAAYESRAPQNYPPYTFEQMSEIGERLYRDKERHKLYNNYLTSVKYNDQILKTVIEKVQDITAQKSATIIYFADHSEDTFSIDMFHDFSSFTWNKARIPFFIWSSPEYQRSYPNTIKNLQDHSEAIFTNDLIFDLVLGVAHIETSSYRPEFDISSEAYSLNIDNAVISAGHRVSTDPLLQVTLNTKKLHNLILQEATTPFKANHALGLGIKGLEIPLCINEHTSRVELLVGHCNSIQQPAMRLETYLSKIGGDFNLLWFSLDNLSESNVEAAHLSLAQLSKQYSLQHRVIIESTNATALALFAKQQWQTSLLLPWEKMLELDQLDSKGELKQLLLLVESNLIEHQVQAISYHSVANELIYNQLIVEMPIKIDAYLREDSWQFSDPDLTSNISTLEGKTTLLIPLSSPFDLQAKTNRDEK